MIFLIPGKLIIHSADKQQAVKSVVTNFYLEASDFSDARWQASHGVIEMNVRKKFPKADAIYDRRRLRRFHQPMGQRKAIKRRNGSTSLPIK